MNSNLQRLFTITQKPVRRIIGLMSGTSLDGLDVALCAISGSGMDTKVVLEQFETVPYPIEVKDEIRKIFAKETISFQQLCLLNPWIANHHAAWILQCLQQWNIDPSAVDLIASHGQTVYHSPKILHQQAAFPNATLQIGDGDHIAVKTGIITLSDFRQKHIAAGGEGAPLALYGDYCLFSQEGEDRIMLNMGGIANFTFLPGSLDANKVFVTDTGPGNTLLDAFARHYFQKEYDEDAQFAKQGTVNEKLLAALKENSFFKEGFPRTTGPELFSKEYVLKAQQGIEVNPFDVMATLTQFSADTITDALLSVLDADRSYAVYMSGGGAHNPLLVGLIKARMPHLRINTTSELGIAGDAKEAVLFAILANEAVMGEGINFGKPGMPAITMGKYSFPA
ncbi:MULTISPECIES: anhydro-N-acetylmuramic acid kinase [unclassified Chitinophaga]|uniref:anhydro-N-acetylmuramic acid kinase n=1 Tax=unclassified Chitinophaga TaxID=2619133 RepID=UPI0009CAAD4F|nr:MULTISPECIES: anhydro-N-acetylmuramic acid kinase [unclassified Chitinophaga]OMP75409.1 anhydro-N-acetylmuramic acid kinase [[Flexibacter] sp. ATCC 35208]WPV67233.1 anhydro-N-acetylmuramic acid kinase [Chitinophaga sp. LS1]